MATSLSSAPAQAKHQDDMATGLLVVGGLGAAGLAGWLLLRRRGAPGGVAYVRKTVPGAAGQWPIFSQPNNAGPNFVRNLPPGTSVWVDPAPVIGAPVTSQVGGLPGTYSSNVWNRVYLQDPASGVSQPAYYLWNAQPNCFPASC